ncbi:hypothetical protein FOG50_00873 [Hanseniaspora uvarum]|nr:hypothetical protein FOG50_00873 [Hanseniaspora uvarum]
MCKHFNDNGSLNIEEIPRDLPTNVKPADYNISFNVDEKAFTFKGEAIIEFDVLEPFTKELNYLELNTCELYDVKAKLLTPVEEEAVKVEEFTKYQKTRFTFAEESLLKLNKGDKVKIVINYGGYLNDKMCGFYRSKYEDENGEIKYQFVTQFEATDARKAFPCYDHPSIKSDFTVKMESIKEFVHISNMASNSETIVGDRKITTFNTLPKHSTYLVAFCVGDFVPVKSQYDYRIPVTTWTVKGAEKRSQYSADFTSKCLEFYENLFDIPFPFNKVDSILCKEFSSFGMENSGMITYREGALLLDPEQDTIYDYKKVSEVIAHEVAHQWFGNLVTMSDWTDLWLNESGATFWSWFCCNNFYPEWNVWESFITDSLANAFALDSLRSSHAIQNDSCEPDEINQIFDAISYAKGGSLLRMIKTWLGEKDFVAGVSSYLKAFAWQNATTADLWTHLEKISGKPVKESMSIWTKNVGHPIVTVEETNKTETEITLKLTQNRFLKTADVKTEEDQVIYPIVLFFKTEANTKEGTFDTTKIFDTRETTITLPVSAATDFYKLNGNQSGFFVTKYPESRYEQLAKQSSLMSDDDKAGLIGEMTSLCAAGAIKTSIFLNLIVNWKKESSPAIWNQMLVALGSIKRAWFFEDKATLEKLKKITSELSAEKLDELEWEIKETDSFNIKELKVSLFSAAVANGNEKYTKLSLDLFHKYLEDDSVINPLYRDTMFNAVALNGDVKDYDAVFKIYRKNDARKLVALRTFTRFEGKEFVDKTFELIKEKIILPQDIYIALSMIGATQEGVYTLWSWITTNWDQVVLDFPPSLNMLSYIVRICTTGFTQYKQHDDVKAFFADKECNGFDMALAQSLDAITTKAKWVERDGADLTEYLAKI